jgi:hypothetical protein
VPHPRVSRTFEEKLTRAGTAKKRQNSRIRRRIFETPGKAAARGRAATEALTEKYHFQSRMINFSADCNHESVPENLKKALVKQK